MRLLHTADWHLGKKLENSERTDEHRDFLDWLIIKLETESIDVLVIAGDIFDTGSPSNTALALYYKFLGQLKATCCNDVVVIGGNHDSISTLNAPKDLLKFFNVHVIGGVPDIFTDQIIEIRGKTGKTELVICAVPFLRDKDIKLSVAGEMADERESRIKQGIHDHYHKFVAHILPYKQAGIPVISTGHLFAAGSSTSESEKEIHMGNLGQVHGDQFPKEFDYVALGHIHKPQVVNKMEHIRYSGSPIPLSFSENEDRKQVLILELSDAGLIGLVSHEVPCYRKLIRIKGDLDTVLKKISRLEDPLSAYPAWVELRVEVESGITDLEDQLAALMDGKKFIERFFTRQLKTRVNQGMDQLAPVAMSLNDLEPKEVFIKRCQSEFKDADYTDLVASFDEVMELMKQEEKN